MGYRPLRASQGEKTPLPAGLGFRWKNLKRRVGLQLSNAFQRAGARQKSAFEVGEASVESPGSPRSAKNTAGGFGLGGFGWKRGESGAGDVEAANCCVCNSAKC